MVTRNKFTFTRAKLSALPPPKRGSKYVYDDTVRGLALGVSSTGEKSFRLNRKFEGRARKFTLGVFDPDLPETRDLPAGAKPLELLGNKAFLNVRMARKLATAFNGSLDVGVDPSKEKRDAKQGRTLGELFPDYITHLINEGKKRSIEPLTWSFERHLGQLPDTPRKKHGKERTKPKGAVNWHSRRLSTITPSEVSRLRFDLAESIGHTTANRVMELLRAIYNFAIEEDPPLFVGANPAAKPGKFKEQKRKRFLESHEAPRFFKALRSEKDQDFKDYVLLSVLVGARRRNMLRMRWDELSLDGAKWRLSGEEMKGGESLDIPLVKEAVEVLRRRWNKTKSEWVFPGGTSSGHMGAPRKKWAKFLDRARLADLHLHDLRRTLGSWMTTMGANTVTIMEALGHRDYEAALRYQKEEAAPVLAAMQRGVSGLFKASKTRKGQLIELPRRTADPSKTAAR